MTFPWDMKFLTLTSRPPYALKVQHIQALGVSPFSVSFYSSGTVCFNRNC